MLTRGHRAGSQEKGLVQSTPKEQEVPLGSEVGSREGSTHVHGDCGLWGGGWNSGQSSSAL